MFFTREDILKIQNALLQLSVKDSELPNAEPVTYDDTLSIVQDGKNKQIKIKNFFNQISLWKREDFINITDKYDEHYISLIEAIKLVPVLQRKDGLVITFQDIEGNWEIYQFRGNITEFFEEDKWFNLYDYRNNIVQSIVPDEEDLTASIPNENGNSLVSLKDRVYDHTSFSGKGYKILRKNIQPVNIAVTKIKVEFSPSSDGILSFSINGKEIQVSVSASVDNTITLVADKIASKLTEIMTEYEVSKDASIITLTRKFEGSVTPSVFSASTTGVVCTVTDSIKREFRNILTPAMINQPNTIYEIRYDFYLNGETIEIQEGCTLKFEGGSLRGGKLLGKVDIEASQIQIFEDIDFTKLTFSSLDISWLGYKFGDDFGAFYNRIEYLLPEASVLFYGKKIFIDSPAHITQKVYLSLKDIECRNYASDVFVLGTEEKSANEVNIKFNFLYSKNENYLKSSNSGIKFINSSFCNISFEHIARIGYPINIVAKNSCGQNIFNWNIIEEGNIGIKYNAGESWTSAQWTEGTIYKFGFIRKFNVGIKWENNVRCNASLISGAIDCVEIADSYDIIDDSNDSEYSTGNIYFLNFVRHPRWKGRKNRDTILEPSYGISTAGDISSAGNIISKYVRLVNGAVEVFDSIAKTPRLDFYNSQNVRVARINSNEDGGIDITPDTRDLNINNNIKVEQIKNKKGEPIIDLSREKPYIAGILQLDSLFCTGDVDSRYFKALGGGIKIYDQIAHLPRLDFFPEESGDYDGRIMLENGGFIIYTKNNFVKIIGGNQIVVPANTESYEVTFSVAKPNTNYNVILSPYCNTNCWIISQSKEGFVLGIKSSTIEQKIGYTIIGY